MQAGHNSRAHRGAALVAYDTFGYEKYLFNNGLPLYHRKTYFGIALLDQVRQLCTIESIVLVNVKSFEDYRDLLQVSYTSSHRVPLLPITVPGQACCQCKAFNRSQLADNANADAMINILSS